MWRGLRGEPPRFATRALKDGRFHFCRLMYPSAYREAGGQGWRTDYPGADTTSASASPSSRRPRSASTAKAVPNISSCAAAATTISSTARSCTSKTRALPSSPTRTSCSSGSTSSKAASCGATTSGDRVHGRVWEQEIGRVLPPERFPDRRHPGDALDVPNHLQRQAHPAGAGDQPVAVQRRRDVRARTRQRRGEHARHLRRERAG